MKKVDKFPKVDKSSWFYKNCKRQRKNSAKICQVCPFRGGIETQEEMEEADTKNGKGRI